ncbi:unnamed protein product [Closterium sp. NIES-64]|nr:unnamed protein product [Closterium sp. NIES-64]
MYSVENPSSSAPRSPLRGFPGAPSASPAGEQAERAKGGLPCVMMQAMGPACGQAGGVGARCTGGAQGGGDARDYVYQQTADTGRFWESCPSIPRSTLPSPHRPLFAHLMSMPHPLLPGPFPFPSLRLPLAQTPLPPSPQHPAVRHELALGACFQPREGHVSPLGEVPPQVGGW